MHANLVRALGITAAAIVAGSPAVAGAQTTGTTGSPGSTGSTGSMGTMPMGNMQDTVRLRQDSLRMRQDSLRMRDSTMRHHQMMQDRTTTDRSYRSGSSGGSVSGSDTRVRVRKGEYSSGGNDTRVPIRKETVSQADPTPMPEPVTPAPTPLPEPVAPVAETPPPPVVETTTTTTTTTQPAMGRRFGNGFTIGLVGGATLLQTNPWRDQLFQKPGYHVAVPIGFDAPFFPLGVRLDLAYDHFRGEDVTDVIGGVRTAREIDDGQILSATLNGKIRLPFGGGRANGRGGTHGLYGIAGAGVQHLRNFDQVGTMTLATANTPAVQPLWRGDKTVLGVNGGAGFGFALGRTELNLEGRYVRAFTPGRRINYVPITLGISFF